MKKMLLDTNAYTGLLSGDERVLDYISKARVVLMSVIVIGELHAGFRGGLKQSQNNELLQKFLKKSSVEIINVTIETAEIFGMVKDNLKKAGTPLPINDIWIAAQAIEMGSILISFDSHFHKIPGLRIWNL
jgi:tRNA(fMet)-specific endonuclease VapC